MKISLTVFAAALLIGAILAGGCGFGGFSGFDKDTVQGSGTIKSEQRNVSGFTKIDAGGAVRMEIVTQGDYAFTIEADDNLLQFVRTEVNGDTLKIYTKGKTSSKTGVKVKISMPALDGLSVSGASSAVVSAVKSDSINLEASGASKIKIDGQAENLTVDASGASGIDAENLRVENGAVSASGASNATISAANRLEADASGASTIYYTGEPKNLVPKSSGASSVKRK